MSHPAVPAVYLTITLGLTMFSLHPVAVAISLAGAFAYACCARGPATAFAQLRWQLPVILLVALANPLFVASGSTEVLHMGPRAIYLEALAYGACMGGLLIASTLWFGAAADILGFDKVMTLAGNIAPTISLMTSMCMRLIPRFVRQGRVIAQVQAATRVPGCSAVNRVRERLRASSVLMGWAMEDSLQTADAMRARGWATGARRTTYTRYRFTATDAIALASLLICGTACCLLAYIATSQFVFYPTMSCLVPWWGYVPLAAWMAVPTVLHILEERRYT